MLRTAVLRILFLALALASVVLAGTARGDSGEDTSATFPSGPIQQVGCDCSVCDSGCFAHDGNDCESGCCPGTADGCDGSCCDCGLLGGLIRPGEACFTDFISPMTNPVFFEDPRTLTEARFIFLNHKVPVLLPGGTTDALQVYAVQLRAAITDRLSLIATKDGYIVSESPLIDDGWADVSLGLKYNLWRDPSRPLLISSGFTFELPVGSTRTLQGNGDGEFNMFLTGMGQVGYWHWITAGGMRLPSDSSAENQVAYWSGHVDCALTDKLYFLTEMNMYHWLKSGEAFPLPVEGGDLFNLGAVDVAGNDIVTQAVGLKYKARADRELGVAFEFPLTQRRGLLDNRLTVDYIVRY